MAEGNRCVLPSSPPAESGNEGIMELSKSLHDELAPGAWPSVRPRCTLFRTDKYTAERSHLMRSASAGSDSGPAGHQPCRGAPRVRQGLLRPPVRPARLGGASGSRWSTLQLAARLPAGPLTSPCTATLPKRNSYGSELHPLRSRRPVRCAFQTRDWGVSEGPYVEAEHRLYGRGRSLARLGQPAGSRRTS